MTTLTDDTTEATADTLRFGGHRHEQRETCPGCGQNLMRTGVQKIVYAFAVCTGPHFDHIYEQLWHRRCFIDADIDTGW